MKRQAHEPKLLGAKDAAALIGVTQTNLRTTAGLPSPYDKVSSGTLWREDEIREFAREYQARQERRAAA